MAALDPLDYYLMAGRTLVVEAFAVDESGCATGLDCLSCTGPQWAWQASAELSRAVRADERLRRDTAVLTRAQAETAFAALGGGTLPGEAALRARFGSRWCFRSAAPLVLRTGDVPAGFRERRVYRLLFANGLPAFPAGGFEQGGHHFDCRPRDVGPGLAWALDVTVLLGAGPEQEVVRVLGAARAALREAGLIPVTVERFA